MIKGMYTIGLLYRGAFRRLLEAGSHWGFLTFTESKNLLDSNFYVDYKYEVVKNDVENYMEKMKNG